MKKLTLFVFLWGATLVCQGQNVAEDFGWMLGNWSGDGSTMDQESRQPIKFRQSEEISFGAGETVLIIKGLGREMASEKEVFSAAGILYWDQDAGAYKMHAFTKDSGGIIADIELLGKQHFQWSFKVPNGRVWYEINGSSGNWKEKGSFQPDGREDKYPFLSMELSTIKES